MGAILLDVNGFGKVAKNLGSAVADRVLAGLADVVGRVSGPSHLVGRYTGQRFLIAMLDTGPQGLQRLGQLLRQSIERTTFVYDGSEISVTASAGIAVVVPEESIETFLNRTEQALHCAKRGGANGAWFDDGSHAGPVESLDLLRGIPRSDDLSRSGLQTVFAGPAGPRRVRNRKRLTGLPATMGRCAGRPSLPAPTGRGRRLSHPTRRDALLLTLPLTWWVFSPLWTAGFLLRPAERT